MLTSIILLDAICETSTTNQLFFKKIYDIRKDGSVSDDN